MLKYVHKRKNFYFLILAFNFRWLPKQDAWYFFYIIKNPDLLEFISNNLCYSLYRISMLYITFMNEYTYKDLRILLHSHNF